MLELASRLLYLDELRPPDGYKLDRAVATTYSLDLLALLLAPFSMALIESREEGDLTRRPMALLAALRRTSGRLAIFCQKGRIAIPKQDQVLYSYLEKAVVEVEAPGGGVFHPKIWALRFVKEDAPAFYRLLCLSRNLTFDKSWDTALVLEGKVAEHRKTGFSRNQPLGEFIKALPSMATQTVGDEIHEHVQLVSEEIRRTKFEVPEGFNDEGLKDDIEFCAMGAGLKNHRPDFREARRLLVVSPFLSNGWIKKTVSLNTDLMLVSRNDSLDALSESSFGMLETAGAQIFVMDEGAEDPDEVGETTDSSGHNEPEGGSVPDSRASKDPKELSGLHAKLYLAEYGAGRVDFWTGSANATSAGFGDQNVEFLVGLWGHRRHIGIDKILGSRDEKIGKEATSLIDLLSPYVRPTGRIEDDQIAKDLEDTLERHRKLLIGAKLLLVAERRDVEGKEFYDLRLKLQEGCDKDENIKVYCGPITLPRHAQCIAEDLFLGNTVTFRNLPGSSLTQFIAFLLEARIRQKTQSVGFVLKVEAEGFPGDRDVQILQSIISNTEQFLKYLLLLLADGGMPSWFDDPKEPGNGPWVGNIITADGLGFPLFEHLVRAFSRSPEKIDQVNSVVVDIQKHSENGRIIPDDFLRFWKVLYSAHLEKAKS